MKLSSERLLYSKIMEPDRKSILSWYMDSKVMKLVTGNAMSHTEAEAKFCNILQINKNEKEGYYSVSLKANNKFIGIAKYTHLEEGIVEIGYGMMPEFWGIGYASEILKALLEVAALDDAVLSLTGIVNKENHASIKVLKKHGFVYQTSSADLKTQYFIKKNYSAAAEGIC